MRGAVGWDDRTPDYEGSVRISAIRRFLHRECLDNALPGRHRARPGHGRCLVPGFPDRELGAHAEQEIRGLGVTSKCG